MMMNFGDALKVMKSGSIVARSGWNGKNMYVYIVEKFTDISTDRPTVVYDSYIMMRNAQGSYVPWLASQTDVLAEDWVIVETHN